MNKIIRIKNGEPNIAEAVLDMMINRGDGVYHLSVVKKNPNRTVPQNRYYWALLTMIGNEIGETPETMHTFFGNQYLNNVKKVIMGHEVELVHSTKSLDTKQFTEYIDEILKFANSFLNMTFPKQDELSESDLSWMI